MSRDFVVTVNKNGRHGTCFCFAKMWSAVFQCKYNCYIIHIIVHLKTHKIEYIYYIYSIATCIQKIPISIGL